jgi:hypothetical protein
MAGTHVAYVALKGQILSCWVTPDYTKLGGCSHYRRLERTANRVLKTCLCYEMKVIA